MMREGSRTSTLLAVFCLVQLATFATSDLLSTFQTALPQLLKGISGSYPRSAYASPFLIWSDGGFPVAVTDSDAPLPVVAAVQLNSTSRVVAFGHEGIPNSCCSTGDNWDRLVLNSIRWLAAAKTASPNVTRLGSPWSTPMTAIKQALASASKPVNVTTTVMDLATFAVNGSSRIDILWIDTYASYTQVQVDAILNFTRQPGKGLLVSGLAWYWSYSHPNANLFTDLSVNKVLWPLGLLVTTDVGYGFQAAPTSPPATWLYYNTYYITSQLLAAKTSGQRFNDTAKFAFINSVLVTFFEYLRPQAGAAWTQLQLVRSGAAVSPVGPDSPFTWRTSYPADFLEVLFDMWNILSSDVTGLRASPSAAAYPGLPPANARNVTGVLVINCTYNPPPYHFVYAGYGSELWKSTGLYAPPGALVNVTLRTTSAAGKGLIVQIGAHTDNLRDKDQWYRLPVAVTEKTLDTVVTITGNPLGGLVYVLVPKGMALGNVQMTISGVIQTPYYQLGKTTKAAWANTIRYLPGPWAELDSGKIVLIVPSKAIRTLADPAPLLKQWNKVMDSMAYLANMDPNRARAERFLVDADISAGWMHSGYPIMAYDKVDVHQEILDVKYMLTNSVWGPYHELGHNHQWSEMMFPNDGTTESFNNLFTMYALETTSLVPRDQWHSGATAEALANSRTTYINAGAKFDTDWSVWTALATYKQLQEGFGWVFYRRIYAAYQNMTQPLADDNVQTWIQTSSKVAGVNLLPFYTKWGFPITKNTQTAVSGLPKWTTDPMNP